MENRHKVLFKQKMYSQQKNYVVLSYDKVLYGAVQKAVLQGNKHYGSCTYNANISYTPLCNNVNSANYLMQVNNGNNT